jgi:membrane-anchored protein YejM (alkaline phosphatase superfamily)
MILSETPHRKRVNQLVHWGHWFTFFNILIAIVIASIYVVSSAHPATPLASSYLVANWFSHIALITFMGFVILVFPLCYWVKNPSYVRGAGAFAASIGLALLALDALFYNRHGIHISANAAQLVGERNPWHWRQWVLFGVMLTAWLTFQLVMANALWKRLRRLKKYQIAAPVIGFFITCFAFSHGGHIWADARLYQPIIGQDNMFPLSYPATAKTLMSRYGLLDIEAYQQRQQLQFDYSFNQANYPAAPVYCSLKESSHVVLLLSSSPISEELMTKSHLQSKPQHFNFSQQNDAALFNVLYGLPSFYQKQLSRQLPLLLDLPQSRGIDPVLYAEDNFGSHGFAKYQVPYDEFSNSVLLAGSNLFIGILNQQQMTHILNQPQIADNHIIVAELNGQNSKLYSNLRLPEGPTSHEDLSPTILNLLGCDAKEELYSTGQSIITPERNWVVSSEMENIVIIHNQQRITIDVAGHAIIRNLDSDQQLAQDLDMNLVTQAIKHLSRFINTN